MNRGNLMMIKRLFRYAFSVAAISSLFTVSAAAQTRIHVLDVGQGLSGEKLYAGVQRGGNGGRHSPVS